MPEEVLPRLALPPGWGGGRRGRRDLRVQRRRCRDGELILPLQGGEDAVVHRVEYGLFVGEAHLRLGGVHVHIHQAVGQGDIQHAGGEFPHHGGVFIGLLQRGGKLLGADGAAVAEEVLLPPVAPAVLRRGDEAPHAHAVALALHGEEGARRVPAQQGVNAGVHAPVPGREEDLLPVFQAAHGDLRAAQRRAQCRLGAALPLGAVAAQELQPGGGIVKEVAHLHGGALGAAQLRHAVDLPGSELHTHSLRRPLPPGGETQAADAGDGGQRLAPEAHRADGLQSPLVPELAGGVAQAADPRVLRGHAAAVVGDADTLPSPAADVHHHALRPGVKGVLHQLLDGAGGLVHHLARGDEIGHMGGEKLNFRHGDTSFFPVFWGNYTME